MKEYPDTPFFSVVVPVYNKVQHVGRSIRSVLSQKFSDFELLLIDDASTDGSSVELRTFKDPRIRIFQRPAPGPGGYAARNLGIKQARGKWVAFLDADDEWSTHHLQLANEIINENNLSLISFAYEWDDGSVTRLPRDGHLSRMERLKILSSLDFIHTNSVVVSKEALLQTGAFPAGRCTRGGDSDLWFRLLVNPSLSVYYFNEVTSKYNTSYSGVTVNPRNVGQTHPVWESAKVALSQDKSLSYQERIFIKRIANRKQLSWSMIQGKSVIYGREWHKNFYHFLLTPKQWLKILFLLLFSLPLFESVALKTFRKNP